MELSDKESLQVIKMAAYKSCILPLARFIFEQGFLENPIENHKIFEDFWKLAGIEANHDLEFHSMPMDVHSKAIKSAIDENQDISAAILIAISIEEDVNSIFRIACIAKGYTHKKITQFIKEVSMKTKVELVLPLLGINVPKRYKTAIFEFLPFRNNVVHGKAIPSFGNVLTGESTDSIESNRERAQSLIKTYPFEKVKSLSSQLGERVYEVPEIDLARKILEESLNL